MALKKFGEVLILLSTYNGEKYLFKVAVLAEIPWLRLQSHAWI